MNEVLEKNALNFQSATPEDDDELLALFQESYPTLGWSKPYLKWQYYGNPAGKAQRWVVRSGGKLVASYAAIPHEVWVRGQKGIGWRMQDLLTRLGYEGRGIFHTLSRLSKDFLTHATQSFFGYAFPNEKSYRGFIHTGWRSLFRIPFWIFQPVGGVSCQRISADVSPLSIFDNHTDQIWESHERRADFALSRQAAFLNWRYLKNPKAKYCPFLLRAGSEEAVLILKYYDKEDGLRWAHICDYFQTGNRSALATAAVSYALHFAATQKCQALSVWSPSKSLFSAQLSQHGFKLQDQINRWFVALAGGVLANDATLGKESRWHLSMGDSDVY